MAPQLTANLSGFLGPWFDQPTSCILQDFFMPNLEERKLPFGLYLSLFSPDKLLQAQ